MSEKNEPALLDPSEIEEIEITVIERSRELIAGERRSIFTGVSGVEFATIREWEPGDQRTRVDWPHSSRSNFRQLVVRESVEERTMDILLVLDASPSTYCGVGGESIARVIARVAATINFSASVVQDKVGAVIFGGEEVLVPLKPGRDHVFELIDAYAEALRKNAAQTGAHPTTDYCALGASVSSLAVRPSLVVVVSDFLYPEAEKMIREMAALRDGNSHDVCVAIVDSAFTFQLPKTASGWIACSDVETDITRMLSQKQFRDAVKKIEEWQATVKTSAFKAGIDAVLVPNDKERLSMELIDFFLDRRSLK